MEQNKKIELYVHIPFCVKKCDYCDFLSAPAGRDTQEQYVQALLHEIQTEGGRRKEPVASVFIGGGTPSILEADLLEKILKALYRCFYIEKEAEVTMEANPGTLTLEKLRICRENGVNRLSLGLQSPDDTELASLGRIHDYQQFLESYQMAREAGFHNVNVDLMFGIPGQTRDGWEKSLRTVAALNPEHISAYSLIIEEGTPFAARNLKLPDEDTEYQMYEDTARILGEYGFEQYEISNYAKVGKACIHNIGYWTGVSYLGLGLGAASLMDGCRFTNTTSLERYTTASRKPDFPDNIRKDLIKLTRQEQMEEFMFLGLRLRSGISKAEFAQRFGIPIEEIYGDVIRRYKELALLQEENGRIFLSRHGIHVSNTVMADFLL
ncbi:radical SAM family heme chaperone HemW [Blautia ammoniilytica]|uniref:Heme chaperone HemW n=1 Tax=Blautia ammoniilytica TaxID=2981782 RepID=A0ABT2TSZ6_9FIRM|nr:radical SAM family heme chaperone HemW [Blautia ammoniilytica]MCU6765366.1 radical SAM family heme chaperone HemW [Blautia ammoniilytica]